MSYPKHTIQLVARRTGLTTETIRAWERRYGAVQPLRSDTLRRLYSDADVERLLLMRQVTLAGRRIGMVAGLPTEDLLTMVREDSVAAARVPAAARPSEPVQFGACLRAARALDADALDIAFARAEAELSVLELLQRIVAPLLRQIGEDWACGTADIRHEHLVTARVRTLLERLGTAGPRLADGPVLVVTTPPAQRHDLGALMIAVLAAARAWRPIYLGPELPAAEIHESARAFRASAVALSVVHPEADPATEAALRELGRRLLPEVALFVGGRAAPSYRAAIVDSGGQVVDDLGSFRPELDRLAHRLVPA